MSADVARPRKKIDPEQVKKLAQMGCSYTEIGAVLGCSHDTIERRFALVIKEGHEHRNCSLRKKQFDLAMAGNATMLIWLGKQFLGQRDKQELSGDQDRPLWNNIEVRIVDPAKVNGSSNTQ